MRRYGNRKRTRADMTRAAQALLLNARDLSRVTAETLVRSYGYKPAEAERELAQAKARRGHG